MAAGWYHVRAPDGQTTLGHEAVGTDLVADTCSTKHGAVHKTSVYHCHTLVALRPGHDPVGLHAGAICGPHI